ncbi:MAG: O-antigen ligase family protein, partial [Sediminibacterium sp.]
MAKQASLSIGSILFTLLYLLVHFIPDLGGADVMGAQWLYSSVLDLVVLGYIFLNKSKYKEAIQAIYSYKFTLLFSGLVIWAMGSYFYALNPIETLVTLARLITTYIIFINVSILFYKQDVEKVFNVVAYIVGFILLYDAIYVISTFNNNVKTNFDPSISSITGNHGNKNVMAASLLIKFPFVIWIIVRSKVLVRFLCSFVLLLGTIALFLLSTRSTFVGLAIIIFIFSATTIYFREKKDIKESLGRIVFFVLPVVLAFFISNLLIANATDTAEESIVNGAVTARIQSIKLENNASSGRLHLWEGAIDYATKHPFVGAGYGNWKLASIPYEKEFTNDLFVPYHSHNDFLEMFADLGIVGGLCFGLMFLLFPIYAFTVWRNKDA